MVLFPAYFIEGEVRRREEAVFEQRQLQNGQLQNVSDASMKVENENYEVYKPKCNLSYFD